MFENEVFEMIPNEIWEAIFEYFHSLKDLLSLRLVNKRFNALVDKVLWMEPDLEVFTIEDFKWISKRPIQVLDISMLEISEDCPSQWSGFIGDLDNPLIFSEFDAHSITDLFKMINQMDHLSHLKLDLSFINANADVWSKLLNCCKINHLTICSRNDEILCGLMDSMELMNFFKEHLPHLSYLESLTIEVNVAGFDVKEDKQLFPDVSKLKNLSILIYKIGAVKYENMFQFFSYFTGLKKLNLNFSIDDESDFNETHFIEFMKASNDFMTRNPQCELSVMDGVDLSDDSDEQDSGDDLDLGYLNIDPSLPGYDSDYDELM